jgi:GTP pyrophosphokinase
LPNKHDDFVKALKFANDKHWDHTRKGTSIPYIAHPMAVASLVMENDGNSDEVIAALLHDVLEDCEDVSFADIESEFGRRVADIVSGLSDANPSPGETKAPWKERKLAYLEHLATVEDDSILNVSCADKLHNARSILTDLNDPKLGLAVWDKFKASRDETLWYYDSLVEILKRRLPESRLATELAATVAAFHSGN